MQQTASHEKPAGTPASIPGLFGAVWPAALVAFAYLWLFHGTLYDMSMRWKEPAFSHGMVIVPAAAFFVWYSRNAWRSTPVKPANIGVVVVAAGLLLMVLASWADVKFLPYVALLVVLGGLMLFLLGWEWFKKLSFPYAFLYFMVPWPDFLVETVSFPMQMLTSIYATVLARLVGVPVVRDGVNLHIPPPVNADFEVAVACSGMHSLIALMCLAAAFAFFTPAAMWKRWTLFAVGLPMALLANIVRVFAILCVAAWISPELAKKAFHDWSSPALFLINTIGLIALRDLMMRKPAAPPAPALATAGPPLASASREDDDVF